MSLIMLHQSTDATLQVGGSIIDRKSFATLREADEMLRLADDAARRMRRDSVDDIELERAKAREAGFEQGRREGVVELLGTLELERRTRELLTERLIEVVEQCVRNILGDIGPIEHFKRRVQHLLHGPSSSRGHARLRVCPSQAHLAQAIVSEQMPGRPQDLSWVSVVSDDECPHDTLILETQTGFVDANVDLTLVAMRDILRKALARANAQWGAT